MAIENVNLGWLKDANNNKFAPKTLSSQAIYDNSLSGLNSSSCQGAIDELKNLFDSSRASYVSDHMLFLPSTTTEVDDTMLILGVTGG